MPARRRDAALATRAFRATAVAAASPPPTPRPPSATTAPASPFATPTVSPSSSCGVGGGAAASVTEAALNDIANAVMAFDGRLPLTKLIHSTAAATKQAIIKAGKGVEGFLRLHATEFLVGPDGGGCGGKVVTLVSDERVAKAKLAALDGGAIGAAASAVSDNWAPNDRDAAALLPFVPTQYIVINRLSIPADVRRNHVRHKSVMAWLAMMPRYFDLKPTGPGQRIVLVRRHPLLDPAAAGMTGAEAEELLRQRLAEDRALGEPLVLRAQRLHTAQDSIYLRGRPQPPRPSHATDDSVTTPN